MQLKQVPFSALESNDFSQWFTQPGQQLLVRSLKARIAEEQSECGRLMLLATPDNGYKQEAEERAEEARKLAFMLEELERYGTEENYRQYDLKISIH